MAASSTETLHLLSELTHEKVSEECRQKAREDSLLGPVELDYLIVVLKSQVSDQVFCAQMT